MLRRFLVAGPRYAVVGAVGPGLRSFCHVPARLQQQQGASGDVVKKREMLEQLLVVQEANFGLNHLNVADTLIILANAYGDLGDVGKKREVLERLLIILEAHFGPKSETR